MRRFVRRTNGRMLTSQTKRKAKPLSHLLFMCSFRSLDAYVSVNKINTNTKQTCFIDAGSSVYCVVVCCWCSCAFVVEAT